MSRFVKPLFLCSLLLVLASIGPLLAQGALSCDREGLMDQKQFEMALAHAVLPELTPPQTPSVTQTAAPSRVSESAGLVDQPAFPTLLGLALDNATTGDGSALTLDLNVFTLKAIANPAVLDRQSLYEQYQPWRRWAATVSLGGTGVAFDRDGDGEVDEALEAKELDDIVSWEVRYRLYGTRDRRDKKNYQRILRETKGPFLDTAELFNQFLSAHRDLIFDRLRDGDEPACYNAKEVAEFLRRPEIREQLREVVLTSAQLQSKADEVNKAIDRSWIWTLVAGGVERGDEFGPDESTLALRGAWGGEDKGVTINLEYAETDALLDMPDYSRFKAAVEYAILWLKGSSLSEEGVRVSWSGAYERFNDVPNAPHDEIAKANMKLDFPVAKGVTIPISVTWANHADLLTDEKEVRGHIGFTFDLAKLLKTPGADG